MSAKNKLILKASSYYLEDVLGLDLNRRTAEGKLSFILLNQPPVCDYHCRRCFMSDYRRNFNPKDALALTDYKEILGAAKESGILCLEISGEGEPLLSKNLLPIIKHANKLGLLTTLITNGNTLTENQLAFFRDNNVTLVFSLHTLNRENYELDNSCEGSFGRKMKNIAAASAAYAKTRRTENGFDIYRLAVHATLQKDNVQEISLLKKFCTEKGIFFSIAPLALVGSALNHPEIHPVCGEKALEEGTCLGDNSIIHSHCSAKVFGREICGTAYYGLNIGWDGAILFDAHCGYEIGEHSMLGNITKIPFAKAVARQRQYMKLLFESISGSCPARDPRGKEFLAKVLAGKIKI